MGYGGKISEKELAQRLRREGYSYSQIFNKVKVSKDTLSRWCKDISLTEEQQARLVASKKLGQKRGSLVAAENKRKLRIERTLSIARQAKDYLGNLSDRDRFIAGIALYFAEGDKIDGKGGFTNADPRLIKFMMNWFTKYCNVPMDRLRGAIWIHEGNDYEGAINFWSNLTGIPKNQFHKTYVVKNKIDSNKVRKNIHSYGVFSIRFSVSDIQRQIMGWISGLFGDRIGSTI
jgi:hypothetical protein